MIALESGCRALLHTTAVPGGEVVGVLDGAVVAYSLANPARPVRVASWGVNGVTGACVVRGQVVAYGADGFATLELDQHPILDCGSGLPVLDAVATHDVVYALAEEALEIRSPRLCLIDRIEIEGGRCLARTGQGLLIGGNEGVIAYDLRRPHRPTPAARLDGLDVVRRAAPPAAPAGSTVALLADSSAVMLRVRRDGIDQIGSHRRAPWFVDNLRCGNLMVKVEPDRLGLVVSLLGEAEYVVPFALVEPPEPEPGRER